MIKTQFKILVLITSFFSWACQKTETSLDFFEVEPQIILYEKESKAGYEKKGRVDRIILQYNTPAGQNKKILPLKNFLKRGTPASLLTSYKINLKSNQNNQTLYVDSSCQLLPTNKYEFHPHLYKDLEDVFTGFAEKRIHLKTNKPFSVLQLIPHQIIVPLGYTDSHARANSTISCTFHFMGQNRLGSRHYFSLYGVHINWSLDSFNIDVDSSGKQTVYIQQSKNPSFTSLPYVNLKRFGDGLMFRVYEKNVNRIKLLCSNNFRLEKEITQKEKEGNSDFIDIRYMDFFIEHRNFLSSQNLPDITYNKLLKELRKTVFITKINTNGGRFRPKNVCRLFGFKDRELLAITPFFTVF